MRYEVLMNFLEKRGFNARTLDMDAELERLVSFAERGLEAPNTEPNRKDSLPMISSYIHLQTAPIWEKPVVVMACSGKTIQTRLVTFHKGLEPSITGQKTLPMPGSGHEVGKDEFYDTLAKALLPYLETSRIVGLSFAYETAILPNLDGIVRNLSKEILAPEVIGTSLVENIKDRLDAFGVKDPLHIVVLNNTVAALLAGSIDDTEKVYDGYASFILDSGLNMAYVNPFDQMIINTEVGTYHPLFRTRIDREIDEATAAPGNHVFEKVLAGHYQGLQAQYTIREAIQEGGIFSGFFEERFSLITGLEDAEIHDFLQKPYGPGVFGQCCANDFDREMLFYILDNVLERVARWVAVTLCACHVVMDKGRSRIKPLAIALEADTYYARPINRLKLNYYIKEFINEKHGFYNELIEVGHANCVGTALAALMN
jgi:hexokinase